MRSEDTPADRYTRASPRLAQTSSELSSPKTNTGPRRVTPVMICETHEWGKGVVRAAPEQSSGVLMATSLSQSRGRTTRRQSCWSKCHVGWPVSGESQQRAGDEPDGVPSAPPQESSPAAASWPPARPRLPLRSGLRAPPPHPAHLPRACQRGRPGFSPRRPLTSETATRRRSIRPTRAPLKPPVRHGVRGCAHRTCAWLASARRRGLDRHPVRPSMLRYRVAASPCPTRGLMGDQLSDKPTPASVHGRDKVPAGGHVRSPLVAK